MKMTFEQLMESKNEARTRRENKIADRWAKLEAKAARHIGELNKADGSIAYYISLPGVRYFESDSFIACAERLVKLGLVR